MKVLHYLAHAPAGFKTDPVWSNVDGWDEFFTFLVVNYSYSKFLKLIGLHPVTCKIMTLW